MNRRLAFGLVALIGALFLAAGLVMGFTTVSRDGTDCGSAFGGVNTSATMGADLQRALQADAGNTSDGNLMAVENDCQSAVSDRKPIAYVLVIPGVVLLLVGVIGALASGSTRRTAETDDAIRALRHEA